MTRFRYCGVICFILSAFFALIAFWPEGRYGFFRGYNMALENAHITGWVPVFSSSSNYLNFVDIVRGTMEQPSGLSHGNTLPIHSVVFGSTHWTMVNFRPPMPVQWPYEKGLDTFGGFRCTHQPSPWISDWSFFTFFPHFGMPFNELFFKETLTTLTPSFADLKLFSKRYDVDPSISLRLAVTRNGGIFEIHWLPNATGKPSITLDGLENFRLDPGKDGHIVSNFSAIADEMTLTRRRKFPLFVVGEIEPISDTLVSISYTKTQFEPTLRLSSETTPRVLIRIGTSFVSHKQAALNLKRELSSYTFREIVRLANNGWNKAISRVSIEPDESLQNHERLEQLIMFYTSIYRALLFPRQLGEIDANGKMIHASPYTKDLSQINYGRPSKVYDGPLSTDSGFWDSYRTVYPMLHLLYPDLVTQILEGWVNAIRESPKNILPQWSSPYAIPSMDGSFGEITMAEAIVNGALSEKSARVAYEYLKQSSSNYSSGGRPDLDTYLKLGYISEPASYTFKSHSVSNSLGYHLTDFCVANAADALNDTEFAKELRNRSKGWLNLFENSTGFFQAKYSNGKFVKHFSQYRWDGPYVEGGPWQFRFYVPHAPKDLRDAFENSQACSVSTTYDSCMCDKLVEMMTTNKNTVQGVNYHEALEMQQHAFGQYAHNNQPVHHVLYMFADAGCPLEGQKWITHTLQSQYGKFGYSGDEDNGEMSSWYLLSSIGLYALVPSSGKYQVGAPPLFREVNISLPNGNKLQIVRKTPLSKEPLKEYIPSETIVWRNRVISLSNGSVEIEYADLMKGGKLVFE